MTAEDNEALPSLTLGNQVSKIGLRPPTTTGYTTFPRVGNRVGWGMDDPFCFHVSALTPCNPDTPNPFGGGHWKPSF